MKKSFQGLPEICELQVSANNLLNWIFQNKSACLTNEPYFVFDLFRSHLLNSYLLYPVAKQKKRIEFEKMNISRDAKYRPIERLRKKFEKYGDSFIDVIVHGSVADGEIIKNWSDLDILAIIKNNVFQGSRLFIGLRKELLEIEKEIYKFDPYQHHGIQFISESDLKFYPDFFLPLEVLKFGKSLLKKSGLAFYLRDSRLEKEKRFYGILNLLKISGQTGVLRHHARNGVYLEENYKNKMDNFYQLKYFISIILLLPSLFLELIDKPVYKKFSFEKIKNYFNERELELVWKCELVRKLFQEIESVNNEIPKEVVEVLGKDYLKQGERLAIIMAQYEIY